MIFFWRYPHFVSASSTNVRVGLFRATAFASDQTQAFVFAHFFKMRSPFQSLTYIRFKLFHAFYHHIERKVKTFFYWNGVSERIVNYQKRKAFQKCAVCPQKMVRDFPTDFKLVGLGKKEVVKFFGRLNKFRAFVFVVSKHSLKNAGIFNRIFIEEICILAQSLVRVVSFNLLGKWLDSMRPAVNHQRLLNVLLTFTGLSEQVRQ